MPQPDLSSDEEQDAEADNSRPASELSDISDYACSEYSDDEKLDNIESLAETDFASVFPLIDPARTKNDGGADTIKIPEVSVTLDKDPRTKLLKPTTDIPALHPDQAGFWRHKEYLTDIQPNFVWPINEVELEKLKLLDWKPNKEQWQKYIRVNHFRKNQIRSKYLQQMALLKQSLEKDQIEAFSILNLIMIDDDLICKEIEDRIKFFIKEALVTCQHARDAYESMTSGVSACFCNRLKDTYIHAGSVTHAFISKHLSFIQSLIGLRKYLVDLPDLLQSRNVDKSTLAEIRAGIDNFEFYSFNSLKKYLFPRDLGNQCDHHDTPYCPNYTLLHVYFIAQAYTIGNNTLPEKVKEICEIQIRDLLMHIPVSNFPQVTQKVKHCYDMFKLICTSRRKLFTAIVQVDDPFREDIPLSLLLSN